MPRRAEVHGGRELPEFFAELQLLEVPGVRGDELDRGVAAGTDRGLVREGLHLLEGAVRPQELDRLVSGRLDLEPLQLPRGIRHPPALVDGLHGIQAELAEEHEVDVVAVGADHRGAAAELRLRHRVGHDGDLAAVQRDLRCPARGPPKARVLRVDDHRAAGSEQLRPRRGDRDVAAVFKRESHPDQSRRPILVLDVRLREGRLVVGAPERRPLAAVEEALGPEFEEHGLAERPVGVGIGEVRVFKIRGEADAARKVEKAVPDRLDFLAAL